MNMKASSDQWKKLNSKSTEDLIKLFQKKANPERGDCLKVLIYRFSKDLLEKCEIICSRRGQGPDVAEIIAQRTFEAYAVKGKFDFAKATGNTIDDSFLIYLFGIAQNQLIDYHRQQRKKELGRDYDGTEQVVTKLPDVPLEQLKIDERIRYEIVQSLPESHQIVYLTYATYEKKGCNLPKKLQALLRKRLGDVSQSTVRAYKKEALDKINDGIKVMTLTKKIAANGRP